MGLISSTPQIGQTAIVAPRGKRFSRPRRLIRLTLVSGASLITIAFLIFWLTREAEYRGALYDLLPATPVADATARLLLLVSVK